MTKKGRKPTHAVRYNSKFNPVRRDQVGELRELSDRQGRVGFLGRIIRVTKDRVAYKIEA